MMHGGPVDWTCTKFSNTALSSTEAEWYAACESAKPALWLSNMLSEIGHYMPSPPVILENNQGCIIYGKRSLNASAMKHLDLKYNMLRQNIKRNRIKLERIPTAINIADILTKPLTRNKFEELRSLLGVASLPRNVPL